jgi:hypothetical protein
MRACRRAAAARRAARAPRVGEARAGAGTLAAPERTQLEAFEPVALRTGAREVSSAPADQSRPAALQALAAPNRGESRVAAVGPTREARRAAGRVARREGSRRVVRLRWMHRVAGPRAAAPVISTRRFRMRTRRQTAADRVDRAPQANIAIFKASSVVPAAGAELAVRAAAARRHTTANGA